MKTKSRKLNNREKAYDYLRNRIMLGEVSYQDRLIDNEIAVKLEMSRMPVREALLQLRSEGFLETTYRGFVLKVYSAENIFNVFEVRLLLEPEAAYQAAQVITPFQLNALKAACEEIHLTDKAGKVSDNLFANWRFRSAWALAVLNDQLQEIMDVLRDRAEQARIIALSEAGFRAETAFRAQGIYEAFAQGSPELAKQRVKDNLILCRDKYCQIQEKIL